MGPEPAAPVLQAGVAPAYTAHGFRRRFLALMGLMICALLIGLPVVAQDAVPTIPENASAKSYGDGWECNIGFQLNEDACVPVIVPENAYATNRKYGSGWECFHGFIERSASECEPVAVPDGGYLDSSGERWRCLRGYQKVGEACLKIALPDNAFLSDTTYGSTWTCQRGFVAVDETCSVIVVPANAFLNNSGYGKPWTCERGFIDEGDLCGVVDVPENAYFDDVSYGSRWRCDRGYAASAGECKALDMPANAHLDRSGNRWDCNRNFQESKGQCVLNK